MNKIDLKILFEGLQQAMVGELGLNRSIIAHPGSTGDALENSWIEMLRKYLPNRYSVDKAMVVDSEGQVSEQIDIVVYDNFYTPFVFQQNGFKYIPAEGVYAVFEVKPDFIGTSDGMSYVKYAGKKVASVRALKRTSVEIINAGSKYSARSLTPIIGGILANTCTMQQDTFVKHLEELEGDEKLDLGCAADKFAFVVDYKQGDTQITVDIKSVKQFNEEKQIQNVIFSQPENSIFTFVLQLSHYIQQAIGTIAAIDYQAYLHAVGEEIDVDLYIKPSNVKDTDGSK